MVETIIDAFDATPTSFNLRLLGRLETMNGAQSIKINGSQKQALLVLLALYVGKPVPMMDIISRLWGDSPPADPRTRIYNIVAELRADLRGVREFDIIASEWSYVLVLPLASIDVYCFRSLKRAGHRAFLASSTNQAANLFRQALNLWRGLPLRQFEPAATWPELRELREEFLALQEDLMEIELDLGISDQVVVDLQMLIRDEPLRERRHTLLMRALLAQGRHQESIEVHNRASTALSEGWGLDPGPELCALRRAAEGADPVGRSASWRTSTPRVKFSARSVAMFACGELTPVTDSENIAEMVDRVGSHIAVHAGRHDGWVIPILGGIALAVFDGAHHMKDAVRCAIDVRDSIVAGLAHEVPRAAMRAAVASGEINGSIEGSNMQRVVLEGRAMECCTDLIRLCMPGAVIVDEVTVNATATDIVYEVEATRAVHLAVSGHLAMSGGRCNG